MTRFIGTKGYFPFEISNGDENYTQACDIWSLGMISIKYKIYTFKYFKQPIKVNIHWINNVYFLKLNTKHSLLTIILRIYLPKMMEFKKII